MSVQTADVGLALCSGPLVFALRETAQRVFARSTARVALLMQSYLGRRLLPEPLSKPEMGAVLAYLRQDHTDEALTVFDRRGQLKKCTQRGDTHRIASMAEKLDPAPLAMLQGRQPGATDKI